MSDMNCLPEEVTERIFTHLCPYQDYKNCALVCSQWRRLIQGVARRKLKNFHRAVDLSVVKWTAYHRTAGTPSLTDRYLHSSCHVSGSLYVFGGCTASFTTFNDLWRLDLANKQWVRPVASGTYPSPKACASMVVWRDELVLFGGWSPPTPLLPHQAPLFFNQLHFYNTLLNTWTVVSPDRSPKPVAGHCSCILSDKMVVFGGSQQGQGTNTNELWIFDILTHQWAECSAVDNIKPLPRYGAFMCTVSDSQAVMLGGCGGANMKFTDCWLLTVTGSDTVVWSELETRNTDTYCPSQLWSHPACKVGDSIVCLSKTNQSIEQNVLQRISRKQSARRSSGFGHSSKSYSSSSSDDEEVRTRSNMAASASTAAVGGASVPVGGAQGSVGGTPVGGAQLRTLQQRRARQLELLEKFEKRLRSHKSQGEKTQDNSLLKRPMFIHSLDISTVPQGYVTWRAPNLTDVYGEVSGETQYYTLTEGQGELILLGGTHPEMEQGMQRGTTPASTQTLNDVVYTISSALPDS